jgi:23S rRNA (guanine2445-N2)-methyltransferase / 23S rRNA (guanine2069-N7)-methyltransferase
MHDIAQAAHRDGTRNDVNARDQHEFFASCMAGLERLLADELRSFGIKRVRPLSGGVSFFCDDAHAYRACLWSRLASRIVLVVARVNAGDAELLYDGVYRIPWEFVVADGASMAVRAHGSNSQLRNTRFTMLKVKDAVVDRLREKRGVRPDIDSRSPRTAIDVRIRENRATVSLDFSGEALNHRAYLAPSDTQDAALSTTLAAGMLAAGGWGELAKAGVAFVDPVCGDGVMLVEAAQVACDMAPGLLREKWGFFGWAEFDADAWDALTAEADDRFEAGLARMAGEAALQAGANDRPDLARVRIVGASASSPMISRARDHVRRAGMRQVVSVELGDAQSTGELARRALDVAEKFPLDGDLAFGGVAFGEAPSGETAIAGEPVDGASDSEDFEGSANSAASEAPAAREASQAPASPLNPAIPLAPVCLVASNLDARAGRAADGRAAEAAFMAAASAAPQGSRFVVAGGQDMDARFGGSPAESLTFGRGRVEMSVSVFNQLPKPLQIIEVPDSKGGAPHMVEVFEANSAQFAARLRKVWKERRKWAKREGVTCYRLYDADLPDYSVAIDVYEGAGDACGNLYLHIAEYAAPASIDPAKARHRFNDVLAIAPVVCDVRPDHVFSKTRMRDTGGSQYRNAGERAYVTTVQEGGYAFEVDLAGKLDTGIFLDNRTTRQMVADLVRDAARQTDASFLNLFAYTGTATVYAAGAGAAETTTVDLSQTYLDWAARNMAANGFADTKHVFERGDVMRWITEARRSGRRFDVVFVDPPTFSNSKAMGRRTWDVQRDHVELLVGVSRLLAPDGVALFCCNLRSFKPHIDDLGKYGVELEDISASTIPADFARTPKIHKCYLVRRAGGDMR